MGFWCLVILLWCSSLSDTKDGIFITNSIWNRYLASLNTSPVTLQAMAYEPILGGKSCIIADQSGSGKTLAYLAPTIQCLRQEELQGLAKSSSKSPRVIILVPTAELASQVGD